MLSEFPDLAASRRRARRRDAIALLGLIFCFTDILAIASAGAGAGVLLWIICALMDLVAPLPLAWPPADMHFALPYVVS